MNRRGFAARLAGLFVGAAAALGVREAAATEPRAGGLDLVGLGAVAYLERLDGGYYGPVPAGEERPGLFVAEWRDMVLSEDTIVVAALVVRDGVMRRHGFGLVGYVIRDGETFVLHLRL